MAKLEQWRHAAMLMTAAAAVVLIGCCALSWSSSSGATELNQLWQPHMGKLTAMVRAARPARRESLSEVAPLERSHRGRRGHYASSWAQKMLSTGDTESPAENSDLPPRSIVTRRYANTHPHYTSDVAESPETGDEGAYAFANTLSRGRDRSTARPARQQELADVPASMMRGHGPITSDVREDREQHDSRAWGFASRMHKPSLAQVLTHSIPRTQSIREERTGAEQSAWDWASSYFRNSRHHHQAAPQHAAAPKPAPAPVKKAAPKPAPEAKVAAAAPEAAATAVHKQHEVLHAAAKAVQKSLRQRKIEAATRTRQDLHSSTLKVEHDKFAQRQREAQNRVREIAAREAASERAADEGAQAEFQEYGAIAAGGVPDGGHSEMFEAKSRMEGRREERAKQETTAQQVAEVAQEAKQMAHAEEEGYEKGYLAGVKAEKDEEGEDKRAWHAGAAERAIKRAQAEKHREAKEAQTQDLRDDTRDDADGDFQVDGGQWGPAAGDWA